MAFAARGPVAPAWIALFLLAALQAPSAPLAADNGAGTYGAPFLRIPVGARLTTSPDVVAGMTPDASMAFSNPAFLAGVPGEVFFSTANWLDEMRYSAASAAVPLGGGSTRLGLGATFLYSGDLQGYDSQLNVVAEDSYYDVASVVSVSHQFARTGLSLGGGVTVLRQHQWSANGNGYAFSLGAAYALGPNLIHASALNFGGRVRFESTSYEVDPRAILGVGRVFDTSFGQLFAGVQMDYTQVVGQRLQIGVDYQLNRLFTLRTSLPDALSAQDGGAPFTAGLGFRYGAVRLDYAYTPQEYFGSSHTFSVGFGFGQGAWGGAHAAPQETAAEPAREEARPAAPATAPVIAPSQVQSRPPVETTVPPAVPAKPPAARSEPPMSWLVVAGTHGRVESAQAEVRALTLLKLPATLQAIGGGRYRVLVGRYDSEADGRKALARFADKGHRFELVQE